MGLILAWLGLLFLFGMLADFLGKQFSLPRVTILLTLGIVIGPSMLDLLPLSVVATFPVFAHIALMMVGFTLGRSLTLRALKRTGRQVFWFSVAEGLITALVVTLVLLLIGVDLPLALLFGGIATATDPAATSDVVRETHSDGNFTRTLLGIVAVDDGWGIIIFSIMLALAQFLIGNGGATHALMHGGWELLGAILLGGLFSVPVVMLSDHVRHREAVLMETLGIVLLVGGIALLLEVSFLLSVMTVGVVVANLVKHHDRPFEVLGSFDWPFLVLFFVLAGARLDLSALWAVGFIGAGYVVARFLGRILGGWVGGAASHADTGASRWMGMALMPQAGVALGMAMLAGNQLPEYADVIYTVTLAATVLFELIGPILTRRALQATHSVRPRHRHRSP